MQCKINNLCDANFTCTLNKETVLVEIRSKNVSPLRSVLNFCTFSISASLTNFQAPKWQLNRDNI